MNIKANFHLHCHEDPKDARVIPYTSFDAIDCAAKNGFSALAFTCHDFRLYTDALVRYAADKNILLISGIELTLKTFYGRSMHVLALNCDSDVAGITTLKALRAYKQNHPECFIIAPHPFHILKSLGKIALLANINLFDAIEHSFFYTKLLNPNICAKLAARFFKKPLVATSDTHNLDFLPGDFITIQSAEKTPAAIFEAIRNGNFANTSKPKSLKQLADYFVSLQ